MVHRAENSSVCNEDIQTTIVGHGGGDRLFGLGHVPHVGGEDKDLCRGTLAEDRISARVEGCLAASHQRELGASTSVLQSNFGTDAARCTGDQHHLPRECLCIIMDLGIYSRIDTSDIGLASAWGHRNVLDLLMMVDNLKNLVQADEGRRDAHC